jgi:Na+/H+-dicarboxylate symporter
MRKKLLRLENVTFMAALLGLAVGIWAPIISLQLSFLGEIFLLLLKMMIIPLILVSVFLAVAKQAAKGELSRVGWRTVAYFLTTSTLAAITGIFASKLLPPVSAAAASFPSYDPSKLAAVSFDKILLSFFSGNPFKSFADGEIIQIVIFSLIMGIASLGIEGHKRDLLVNIADGIHDLVMTVIQKVLLIAPLGVLSLVAAVVAKTNMKDFSGLGWFFAATGLAALVHSLLTLPTLGRLIGHFHPYKFIFQVKEALIVALATASSSATLPVSTRVLENNAGVSPKTTGFVLPLGATLNMDGSALYQSLVILFLGGLAGIDFTFAQQLLVILFVLLSSAGTAGIPGGGLMMMGTVMQMVGIPLELIGIYLLVDRFWDPIITAINVMGDLFGAKVIDRFVER